MKGSIKIGRIAGINIFIHWTFAILIAYIIFSNYSAGKSSTQVVWTIIFVCSIFVTIFLHELGHALAAKRYNIKTRDITLLPIGGLARLETIPEKPIEELVVAIAGPLVNVGLAIITGLLITFPGEAEMKAQLLSGINGENFFLNFFIINLWLAFFNLIPAFPMDGGRVFRAILAMNMQRHLATALAARIGQLLAVGFVFAGFFSNPFLIFIGLFIILGAQAETENTRIGFFLRGHMVRDIVMTNFETIDENETIKVSVQKLLNGQGKDFLVLKNGSPSGTLNRAGIIEALSRSGENTPVGAAMDRKIIKVEAGQEIEIVYREMLSANSNFVLVYENHQFRGVLDLENILEYIMIQGALENKKR